MADGSRVQGRARRLGAPHRTIAADDQRDRFTLELFDLLWDRYRQRVTYAEVYERVVAEAGGTFVNDHIAFRTLASQRPLAGIVSLARIFETLGYRAAGCYQFSDKHLSSIHYQHPTAGFPKLFISELQLWELAPRVRKMIHRTLRSHREPLGDETLAALRSLDAQSEATHGKLLKTLSRYIQELPWEVPSRKDVQAINAESQFAAWVLLHGYNVNHFTALINSHGAAALSDIEKTAARLRAAGVPMKAEIEGAPGSKLRQTATEAVMVEVPVRDGRKTTTMPWTYAYFELAERGEIVNPETGRRERFEGFLGPQATQLFEMTKVK